jgi:hypothetical protein
MGVAGVEMDAWSRDWGTPSVRREAEELEGLKSLRGDSVDRLILNELSSSSSCTRTHTVRCEYRWSNSQLTSSPPTKLSRDLALGAPSRSRTRPAAVFLTLSLWMTTFPPSSSSSALKERLEVEGEPLAARDRREDVEPDGRIPLARFLMNGEAGSSSKSILAVVGGGRGDDEEQEARSSLSLRPLPALAGMAPLVIPGYSFDGKKYYKLVPGAKPAPPPPAPTRKASTTMSSRERKKARRALDRGKMRAIVHEPLGVRNMYDSHLGPASRERLHRSVWVDSVDRGYGAHESLVGIWMGWGWAG